MTLWWSSNLELHAKVKPPFGQGTWREHPILHAARSGALSIVRRLLDLGADVNYKSYSGQTPLALAACGGHFEVVEMLVGRGACLLSVDRHGHRPIVNAASKGHHAIEDYLLDETTTHAPARRTTRKRGSSQTPPLQRKPRHQLPVRTKRLDTFMRSHIRRPDQHSLTTPGERRKPERLRIL
ncbi:hypothetical protein SI65_09068 [Aspergillus cristatus]|uniref:Uncharacterized protein n=1 Tax=Aspergillus cristatus TaxID=573508 RepID=A0A1E3B3C7_ASPCR|nr:hypothetical protein SI65_09068 [Aspergillus cristatus]